METLRQVWAFIAAIVDWLNAYKFDILAVASAIGAAVVTAHVMRRLDEGRVRGLGIWFTGLGLLFVLTIVSVRAAVAVHQRADPLFLGAAAEPHAPYAVALLVLLLSAVIWWSARKNESEIPSPPGPVSGSPRPAHASSAILVLITCAALVTVLWIVDAGIALNESAGGAFVSSAGFLGQAAAAGLLAMAIIQGVRTIVPIRGVFHRAALIRWIDESVKSQTPTPATTAAKDSVRPAGAAGTASTSTASDATASGTKTGAPATDTTAPADDPSALLMDIARMASPASGAHHYALFDLPIEQLCGQLAAAADRLLDNVVPAPQTAPRESSTISSPAATEGSRALSEQPAAEKDRDAASLLRVLSASRKDIDQFVGLADTQAAATQAPPAVGFGSTGGAANSAEMKEGRERLRLRAAISQRIQQNIDRLHIDATFWWKRLLRGVAVTICGVLGLTLLDGRVSAVVFAIVGGFVATVARDLVAIVEKVRR